MADPNNKNKKVTFKNCVPYTDCISETNNIYHAKDIDVVMPMHNLIGYSNNYSKTSGSLWEYCRDEPVINNGVFTDAPDDPDSVSFKDKQKMIGQTGNKGTKDVQIMVPLKYLSIFWELFKFH